MGLYSKLSHKKGWYAHPSYQSFDDVPSGGRSGSEIQGNSLGPFAVIIQNNVQPQLSWLAAVIKQPVRGGYDQLAR